MNIGTRLSILLEEEDISRKEFAERLHINYNTANGYITNRRLPDCQTLFEMATALGTSTDYLMGLTNIKHHRDLYFSDGECHLISNYRSLSPDLQKVLLDISCCLYKSRSKDFSIWKQPQK